MPQSAANGTNDCFIFTMLERVASGRRTQGARMCLALHCCVFSLSSPAGGEGRGEEAVSPKVRRGLPPPRPSPRSSLAGRGRDPSNTLNTYECPSPRGWLAPVTAVERFGSSTVVKIPL